MYLFCPDIFDSGLFIYLFVINELMNLFFYYILKYVYLLFIINLFIYLILLIN